MKAKMFQYCIAEITTGINYANQLVLFCNTSLASGGDNELLLHQCVPLGDKVELLHH